MSRKPKQLEEEVKTDTADNPVIEEDTSDEGADSQEIETEEEFEDDDVEEEDTIEEDETPVNVPVKAETIKGSVLMLDRNVRHNDEDFAKGTLAKDLPEDVRVLFEEKGFFERQ